MNENRPSSRLAEIPAVGHLLELEEVQGWLRASPRGLVVEAVRRAVEETRQAILSGRGVSVDEESILQLAEHFLAVASLPSLIRVINATGIVLHTGLGRAPLCAEAIEAVADAAAGYCNLELDLETGERGRRADHIVELACRITGAESATVVNNNAAATLLTLKVLAEGREVIVSRGQLVEIGGSYRLPDVMAASGAILREVGTTNRTRLDDYSAAVGDRTAAVMRVHASNYRIVGFTEEAPVEELIELAHRRHLPFIDDVGSGALVPLSEFEASGEPIVSRSVRLGADVVCFSGDKLLGGPQCGLIVGRKGIIEKIENHPLMRTYRVDKLTLLALEATLRLWVDPDHAVEKVPVINMLSQTADRLSEKAQRLLALLTDLLPDESFEVGRALGFAGGGAMPDRELETVVVEWRPAQVSAAAAAHRLRTGTPPVLVRVHGDALCLDVRTILPREFDELAEAVVEAAQEEDSGLTVLNP